MKHTAKRSRRDEDDLSTFLGLCFEHGLKFKKNIDHAKQHYRDGVKSRNGVSAYRLALILSREKAPWKSLAKLYWLAGSWGVTNAYVNFGVLLEKQDAVYNKHPCVYWYRKASRQNDPLGTFNLARCYWHGIRVRVNRKHAMKLYKTALKYFRSSEDEGDDFGRAIAECETRIKNWANTGLKRK